MTHINNYHSVDATVGVLLVSHCIIESVVTSSILLPQAAVADFGYPVLAFWFYCFNNFKLFGFPIT
jgi:hypothetical protein